MDKDALELLAQRLDGIDFYGRGTFYASDDQTAHYLDNLRSAVEQMRDAIVEAVRATRDGEASEHG